MPVHPKPPPPPDKKLAVYLEYIEEVFKGDYTEEAKLEAIGEAVENSKK